MPERKINCGGGGGSALFVHGFFACQLLLPLLCVTPSYAANIFDDDWVPPAAQKVVVERSQTTTQPAPPEEQSSSPTTNKPPATAVASTASTSPRRHAIPQASERAESRKVFKELFARELADRTPAARRALAVVLLDKAVEMPEESADRFVLISGAAEASKDVGDLPRFDKSADLLAATFEVDALPMKSDAALKMNLRGSSPKAAADNCAEGSQLAAKLMEMDDYATAARLLASLRSVAPPASPLATQIQGQIKELETLRVAEERMAAPREKLRRDANDPAANLAVGRFVCFVKGDWQRGLPMLARGSDSALKGVAERDLSNPTESGEQAALADQWWMMAAKEPGAVQRAMHARSAQWYAKCLPLLTGLSQELAKKRTVEATDGASTTTAAAKPLFDPVGKWKKQDGTELIIKSDGTLKLSRKAGGGTWKIEGGTLILDYDKWGHQPTVYVDKDTFKEGKELEYKRVRAE